VRFLYNLLIYLALPFILLRLLWRSRNLPDYRKNISERFGFCPHKLKNCIWVHSVSVGESIAAIPLIKLIQKNYPNIPIVVTNMTPTGRARIKAAFNETVLQTYIPYDFPDAVHRFLNRINPKIAIILETELWPNLFAKIKEKNIPLIVTNARLSEKSFLGYQRIASVTKDMLTAVTKLAAQGKADLERFISLGLSQEKGVFTGNLKFDLEITSDLFAKGEALRKKLGEDRPVWIAASTHEGEEEIILAAHKLILEKDPNALLVLVPRHPNRFDQVAELVTKNGFSMVRRSQNGECSSDTKVYLGDTMGEMMLLFASIDVAFVAGSFAEVGGHNVLEPAALSKPVLSGPILFNFTEISQKLMDAKGLLIVKNAEELAQTVNKLFGDKNYCKEIGENAKRVVDENRGALLKQFHLIEGLLAG